MPLTEAFEKQVLDWALGGAAGSQPTQRWIQFATQSPTQANAFDGPFSPRNTVTFAAANSPQMSKTNLNTISLCTATAAGTAVGWNLYDRSVAGTRIAFGTCTAAIGCKSGDQPALAPGTLKITLT
jgi:hypothetical protein